MLTDFKYALRMLRKSPVLTAAAVLSLGLGIGANTAIFSLLDILVLQSLPVRAPSELYLLTWSTDRFRQQGAFSETDYGAFVKRSKSFSEFLGRRFTQVSFGAESGAERVTAEMVTGNYFSMLGVKTILGRTLVPDDDRPDAARPVVVLSHEFWKRRLGSDPGVLGKTVYVNTAPLTVVGVTSPGFQGLDPGLCPEIRMPMHFPLRVTPSREPMYMTTVGRLKDGVPVQRARAELELIYRQQLAADTQVTSQPEPDRRRLLSSRVDLQRAGHGLYGLGEEYSRPLLVLMGVVGTVLLIACVNVGNLLLARAVGRRPEIAVRLALGASRLRLVRQLLAESLLLAMLGGAAGVLIALWVADLLVSFVPAGWITVHLLVTPNARLLGFTALLSILAAVLFGLAPALSATRRDLTGALHGEGRVVGGRPLVLKALLSGQLALSLVLLITAGLLIQTLKNLRRVDMGYEGEKIVMLGLNPALAGRQGERTMAFYEALLTRVRALPGVRAASYERVGLLGRPFGVVRMATTVEGHQPGTGEDNPALSPDRILVSPGYFKTVGLPILAGRDFTEQDNTTAARVAIVNEKFARYYFGRDNPIGRHVGWNGKANTEIVGVVRDARHYDVREEPVRAWYVPYAQVGFGRWPQMTLHVRVAGEPAQSISTIRHEVQSLDQNVPVFDVKTLEARVDEKLAHERMLSALSGFFGPLATLLAVIGLYGVMASSVARRTREIGIRMALGAGRDDVLGMVLRETAAVLLAGTLAGLTLALTLQRAARSLLFGVTPTNPGTLLGAVVLLAAVGLLGGYIPARRAAAIDPMSALRHE